MIHYCTALHLHYQLPLGLLANGTQIERRSWKAESCEVFSDPSCNADTRQLPLILCTASVQALKYKVICWIILQLFMRLHGFKFLQFFCSAVHFSYKIVAASEGAKTVHVANTRTFLFQFCCTSICFPLIAPFPFFSHKICKNLLW